MKAVRMGMIGYLSLVAVLLGNLIWLDRSRPSRQHLNAIFEALTYPAAKLYVHGDQDPVAVLVAIAVWAMVAGGIIGAIIWICARAVQVLRRRQRKPANVSNPKNRQV